MPSESSKVISRTRLGENLVWYGLFPYLSASFKWSHFWIPSDECHWYSRPVLPALCGIIWRTWECWWITEYAKCNAVNLALCMVFWHYAHSWLPSFLIGIGVGAEYPCGSVSASEQSEEPGINKKAQHRWFALATSLL